MKRYTIQVKFLNDPYWGDQFRHFYSSHSRATVWGAEKELRYVMERYGKAGQAWRIYDNDKYAPVVKESLTPASVWRRLVSHPKRKA